VTSRRGTSNTNDRGSSYARRARKQWLLDTFGDGTTAPCAFCHRPVTFCTISVDRFPIPGCEGGKYVKGNIRPSCGPCNSRDGSLLGHARKALKLADENSTLLMVASA
jgi:hypothetical protein